MPLPEVQTFANFFLVVLKEIFFIVEKLSVLEQELLYSKAECILYNWTSIKIYLLLKIHEKEANMLFLILSWHETRMFHQAAVWW